MSETKRFSLVVYDGINLFRDGTWTKLEFKTVEEGQEVIGFLETLNDEQVDQWIRLQSYMNGSHMSFNRLKYNTSYSGQTTNHNTRTMKDGKWKETPNSGSECIQAVNFFDVQWSNCPIEVADEVRQLWRDVEYGNDAYFYDWEDADPDTENYPVIKKYLKSRGITECHIHWWW